MMSVLLNRLDPNYDHQGGKKAFAFPAMDITQAVTAGLPGTLIYTECELLESQDHLNQL